MSRKKYLIQIIEIIPPEMYKRFEIKLPANVKKVTGVVLTTNIKELGG